MITEEWIEDSALALGADLCGIASAHTMVEPGRRIGYKRLRLDTVLEPAKSLYGSAGFREIPPYPPVPIEGAVFMEMEL